MKRKKEISLILIVLAVLVISALAIGYHFKQVKIAEKQVKAAESENLKAEWTWLNDDISFNQSMAKGLSILFGPSGYVFKEGDTDGYYVEMEHIKDLGQGSIMMAAFMNEPMQIEKLDLEYQIYQVEQDKEVGVYSQIIPYPSNGLEPHSFYEYDFEVDYWDQDIFEKGQQFIIRLKHSNTCDYYLAEADFHGMVSLVKTNVVRYDEFKVEIR